MLIILPFSSKDDSVDEDSGDDQQCAEAIADDRFHIFFQKFFHNHIPLCFVGFEKVGFFQNTRDRRGQGLK